MATVSGSLPAGANSPQKIVITFTSTDIDLSTVTAVAWNVRKPDGTTTTWSATITSQTATTLVTQHVCATADTTGASGVYIIEVDMTIGGSTFPMPAVAATFAAQFAV